MANNSDFAGPGGAVAEDKKQMSYPDMEQIGKIEQELEKAEREFRKASEAKSFDEMMRMHNRLCQLVAALSAAYTGISPTVFARFYVPEKSPSAPQSLSSSTSHKEQSSVESAQQVSKPLGQASAPEKVAKATSEKAEQATSPAEPSSQNAGALKAEEEELPDISVLEKQLAELAGKMQKCLEAGDMDGMLIANEGMGSLSELMTRVEAKNKEKKKALAASISHKADPLAKITEVSGHYKKSDSPSSAKSGAWSTGDTMALAKQRAEERKRQQKLADSFESVVGEVAEKPADKSGTTGESTTGAKVDQLFNDRQMSRMKDSRQEPKPAVSKPAMTQEQLREKLEAYNFYQILSVPSTSSFEELHKSFFKKLRKLNKKLASKSMEMWQFQEFVASLCLAHDVLKFPNARLQYDLVIFGTDGGTSAESTAKAKLMPLKELLKFSTLINARELSEAVEKHKGSKDERELGYYLVEKGLLSNEEFDSILFAQKLVSAGKLTVAQFELAMQEMRENSIPLLDTLVASEWIQPQDVFSGDFL